MIETLIFFAVITLILCALQWVAESCFGYKPGADLPRPWLDIDKEQPSQNPTPTSDKQRNGC